jgi:hypothetical protein
MRTDATPPIVVCGWRERGRERSVTAAAAAEGEGAGDCTRCRSCDSGRPLKVLQQWEGAEREREREKRRVGGTGGEEGGRTHATLTHLYRTPVRESRRVCAPAAVRDVALPPSAAPSRVPCTCARRRANSSGDHVTDSLPLALLPARALLRAELLRDGCSRAPGGGPPLPRRSRPEASDSDPGEPPLRRRDFFFRRARASARARFRAFSSGFATRSDTPSMAAARMKSSVVCLPPPPALPPAAAGAAAAAAGSGAWAMLVRRLHGAAPALAAAPSLTPAASSSSMRAAFSRAWRVRRSV